MFRFYSRDDNDCSGRRAHSAECQKPQTEDGLTIGLAVALPVAAVIVVLGFFLFRNYRKNKKEDMEHDPDFDENGEATALPDFPNNFKGYEMEDPFDNRNSVRFPVHNYGMKSSSALIAGSKNEGYVESFVLPYQHQTGSKVSLDEYARQLGEYPAYGQTPRGSTYLPSRTRNSSISNNNTLQAPLSKAMSVSPQKSNLKYETRKDDYENIPNHSVTEINDTNGDSGIEEVSDTSSVEGPPKFSINYENESEPRIAKSEDDSNDSFNTTTDHHPANDLSDHNDELDHNDDIHEPKSVLREENASPFNDNAQVEEQIEGDFDFSSESANVSATNTVGNNGEQEQLTANTSATNINDDNDRKSVRISAFNLLKNVSDDENDENDDEYDDDKPLDNGLSPEQEEELNRMKSVYKLYFDRENSVKRKNSVKSDKTDMDATYEFKADPEQPLPQVEMDQYLKINNNLKGDTDYSKRMTTTSSIYTDHNALDYNQYEPQYENNYQYAPQLPPQEQYNYYLQDQNFQQFYQQHVQSLPPLQKLPNPSDFRKSTIQTFTDYHPRTKNAAPNSASPPGKQPFVPIENDNVWTSPVNSPSGPQSPVFENGNGMGKIPSVPSATQLARSSVVMLNPVTEITKQRKFRPAGSIPNVHRNNHAYANGAGYQYQTPNHYNPNYQQSNDSLVPGGSKEDVRKMMNSNF